MIYPATYNITILQNATWKGIFRVTQDVKELDGIDTTAPSPRFSCFCHDLNAGDKVVLTASGVPSTGFVSVVPDESTSVPCGLKLDNVYYVISSGLTDDSFYVASSHELLAAPDAKPEDAALAIDYAIDTWLDYFDTEREKWQKLKEMVRP